MCGNESTQEALGGRLILAISGERYANPIPH
jgi:hypothetical protein